MYHSIEKKKISKKRIERNRSEEIQSFDVSRITGWKMDKTKIEDIFSSAKNIIKRISSNKFSLKRNLNFQHGDKSVLKN